MTVARQIVRLSPALLLGLVVAVVACQQGEAGGASAPGVDPREPATVAQGAEPNGGGLLVRWLDRKPVDVLIPTGTPVQVRLLQPLSGKVSRLGQGFLAAVAEDLVVDDRVAIPAGARVTGTVRDLQGVDEGDEGTPRMALSFDAVELPSGGAAHLDGLVEATPEGREMVLPADTHLTFTLQSPATVELALEHQRG